MGMFVINTDSKAVYKFLSPEGPTSFRAALIRNYADIMPEIADKLITTIKGGNWFTYNNPQPGQHRGNLKKKLYKSGARVSKDKVSVDVGWAGDAAIYGPIMEWGPKKKSWVITPKGFRTDVQGPGAKGSGPGQAQKLRALRFVWKGKVTYLKSVKFVWKDSYKRPHVSKAMDQIRTWVDTKMDQAIKDADRAIK